MGKIDELTDAMLEAMEFSEAKERGLEMLGKVINNHKKVFMHVNVILTFESTNEYGETQEFFELALPVSKTETDAMTFLNNELFMRIYRECELLNRRVEDLTKISTASDWRIFEKTTNLESLWRQGHSCKWYFGVGRADLDAWEIELMSKYKFGIDVDMSWVGDPVLTKQYADNMIEKIIKNQTQSTNIGV
jgi:hypothetical protein